MLRVPWYFRNQTGELREWLIFFSQFVFIFTFGQLHEVLNLQILGTLWLLLRHQHKLPDTFPAKEKPIGT
jgi:hypothetical protein